MQNLLDKVNAQTKFIKAYKVEDESLMSITTYKHSSEIALYLDRGNSNKIMGLLVADGLEFEKEEFEGSNYLKYRIDFSIDYLKISFIKTSK